MPFTITIDTANAAFQPTPGDEIARILVNVAERVAGTVVVDGGKVIDVNGNVVGEYAHTDDD